MHQGFHCSYTQSMEAGGRINLASLDIHVYMGEGSKFPKS